MTNFPYTRDIPDGPNNPSNDQPDMEENTNSIDSLINVDHVSFEQTNGGTHRKVSLTNIASPAIPPGIDLIAYSSAVGPLDVLFVKDALQDAPLFGTTNVPGGFATLYAGLKIMFGTDTKVSGGAVSFPAGGFPTAVLSVQCTVFENNNNRHFVHVKTSSPTGFTVASRDSSGQDESNTFYWTAIGY